MKSLLIDIGATRIKYSVFCNDSDSLLNEISSNPFPIPREEGEGKNETDIKEIESVFNKIIYDLLDNFQISNVFICSQMHGFILRNSKKELITDFISWKDERAFEKYHPNSGNNFFDDFSKRVPNFQDITGIEIRAGIPVINIYSMSFDKNFCQDIEILNLAEYLIENLTGLCSGSHKSLSESLGFHNLNKNLVDEKIKNIFNINLLFKKSYDDIRSVSEWKYNGNKVTFFTPVGDMQCATYGLNVSLEENVVINLGTGSQIITQILSKKDNNFEKRSYIQDNFLDVFTHFPCGRSIAIYIDIMNDRSEINYWDELNSLNIKNILSSKEVNLAIFKSAKDYQKINKSDFQYKTHDENIALLNGMFKSLVSQYESDINKIKQHKKINKILLAGGVAHKLDFIESLFEEFYSIQTKKLYVEDETILGMKNIINKLKI